MSPDNLNIGNSIFPGFNDKDGLMICGYEWGWSKADEESFQNGSRREPSEYIDHTFANKGRYYGNEDRRVICRYDLIIKRWFGLWGCPLNEKDLGGAFEKAIVQTNWANTDGNTISDYGKFLSPGQVENFIYHIEKLRPKLILFIGSKLINYLNRKEVLPKFKQIMGEITEPRRSVQKKVGVGIPFKVWFQKFEHCQVVCLPHASAARGLSYDYIALFKPEMGQIISEYKVVRGFGN